MKRGAWLVGGWLLLAASVARAEGVADTDFRQWSFGAYGDGGSARASVTSAPSAPPRLRVQTLTLPGQTVFATAIKSNFASSAALAGARFTMQLGVLGGEGAGQAIALLLEQAGSLYALPVGIAPAQAARATLPFSGTLDAIGFTRVAGSGPTLPVLDGSAATRFGFAAGNSDSLAQTQYYDSYALDIAPPRAAKAAVLSTVESVPTLSETALLLLASLLALAAMPRLTRSAAGRR